MSTKYKASNPDSAYFITVTTVGWVDIFTRQNQKNLILDSLRYCQKQKGLEIYAWVLMPSHLHMICRSTDSQFPLAAILRDFKKHTSKEIVRLIKEEPESRRSWVLNIFSAACEQLKRDQHYKVWQTGYHAKELFSHHFIFQKMNYIHQNPVDDGIVLKPEEYPYSSARNYAEMENLLDVVVIPSYLKAS